jgi:hypothetical protein
MKRRATPKEADSDFESLEAIQAHLDYPLTIFLNIDSAQTFAERCPKAIAGQTVCFATLLTDGELRLEMRRCG